MADALSSGGGELRLTRSLRECRTLEQLLSCCNIRADDWQAVIVCDGSGGTRQVGTTGWGAVLIEQSQINRRLFYGGTSYGTSQTAEIMAVLHPLLYLAEQEYVRRQKGYRVHVLTDSTYVAGMLAKDLLKEFQHMKAHLPLWLAVHGTQRRGLDIRPHYTNRDQYDLNRLCHDLAGINFRAQKSILKHLRWDAEGCNPSGKKGESP